MAEKNRTRPSAADIKRYLEIVDALNGFECSHFLIRGYGAFARDGSVPLPDPSVIKVKTWLEELANAG